MGLFLVTPLQEYGTMSAMCRAFPDEGTDPSDYYTDNERFFDEHRNTASGENFDTCSIQSLDPRSTSSSYMSHLAAATFGCKHCYTRAHLAFSRKVLGYYVIIVFLDIFALTMVLGAAVLLGTTFFLSSGLLSLVMSGWAGCLANLLSLCGWKVAENSLYLKLFLVFYVGLIVTVSLFWCYVRWTGPYLSVTGKPTSWIEWAEQMARKEVEASMV